MKSLSPALAAGFFGAERTHQNVPDDQAVSGGVLHRAPRRAGRRLQGAFGFRPRPGYVALRNDVAAVVELRPNRCGRLCLSVLHQWWGGVLAAPTAQAVSSVRIYGSVLYQCPTTGMNVQAWFDDDTPADDSLTYVSLRCPACARVHLVNRAGKTRGDEE